MLAINDDDDVARVFTALAAMHDGDTADHIEQTIARLELSPEADTLEVHHAAGLYVAATRHAAEAKRAYEASWDEPGPVSMLRLAIWTQDTAWEMAASALLCDAMYVAWHVGDALTNAGAECLSDEIADDWHAASVTAAHAMDQLDVAMMACARAALAAYGPKDATGSPVDPTLYLSVLEERGAAVAYERFGGASDRVPIDVPPDNLWRRIWESGRDLGFREDDLQVLLDLREDADFEVDDDGRIVSVTPPASERDPDMEEFDAHVRALAPDPTTTPDGDYELAPGVTLRIRTDLFGNRGTTTVVDHTHDEQDEDDDVS